MLRTKHAVAVIFFLTVSAGAGFAQKKSDMHEAMAATKTIQGTIVSFRSNILDVQPETSPPVWTSIPQDMKVDRDKLKPGTEVSVETRWADTYYLAVKPPEIVTAKRGKAKK